MRRIPGAETIMARKIKIQNTRRRPAPPSPGEEDEDLDQGSPLGSLDAGEETGDEEETETPRDGEDARLRRAAGTGQRRTHAAEDVGQRDDGLESAKRRNFRDEWTQEALPKLPPIPGYHLCWLSSTNQYDPISKRVRMGYTPVKPEELPGFEHLTHKSGQWEGMIGVNEMLLYKIPLSLYSQIMTEFHHDGPLEEEAAIREKAEEISSELTDREGEPLITLERGMQSLGRRPKRKPVFTG